MGRNLIPGLSRNTPFNILYHGNFIIITVYALRRKYENLSAFRNSYYYFSFYILIYFSKYFGLTEFKRLKLLQIIKKIISFIFHLVTALLIRASDVFCNVMVSSYEYKKLCFTSSTKTTIQPRILHTSSKVYTPKKNEFCKHLNRKLAPIGVIFNWIIIR